MLEEEMFIQVPAFYDIQQCMPSVILLLNYTVHCSNPEVDDCYLGENIAMVYLQNFGLLRILYNRK